MSPSAQCVHVRQLPGSITQLPQPAGPDSLWPFGDSGRLLLRPDGPKVTGLVVFDLRRGRGCLWVMAKDQMGHPHC